MKKIFGLVAVAAIAALNVVVSNNNKEELSDLSLENVEASAYTEIIYLPHLENGLRCLYEPLLERCVYFTGPFESCPDFACQY
ncbi:MAG: hypothetical protein HUJ97_08295 [Bacteroidales bacterium]|nr:hypothetical protein [Bacteroidales bacterium]